MRYRESPPESLRPQGSATAAPAALVWQPASPRRSLLELARSGPAAGDPLPSSGSSGCSRSSRASARASSRSRAGSTRASCSPSRRRFSVRALPGPHRRLGRRAGLGSRRRRGRRRRGKPPRRALADDSHEGARRSALRPQPAVALLLLQARGVRRRFGDREGRGLRLRRRRHERLGHPTARPSRHDGRLRTRGPVASRRSRHHQGAAARSWRDRSASPTGIGRRRPAWRAGSRSGSSSPPSVLRRVEAAELALRALGFRQVRVRDFGSHARVEVEEADIADWKLGRPTYGPSSSNSGSRTGRRRPMPGTARETVRMSTDEVMPPAGNRRQPAPPLRRRTALEELLRGVAEGSVPVAGRDRVTAPAAVQRPRLRPRRPPPEPAPGRGGVRLRAW
jgi:hypothetical protein